ncbi:MAG: ParB N-terminal domain-containing protein [Magnetococcales bacterium]|nr:ParB N-terminal domain-containing protein [Magnetococcales bacterium]
METIPISNILVGHRLRRICPKSVETLAQSIGEIGLMNPVMVVAIGVKGGQQYKLIAGNHRLEACKQLGMTEIAANVVPIQDDLDQKLAEIDENLCRCELNHLERAEHLAERKDVYEKKHPETAKGKTGARKMNQYLGRGINKGEDVNELNSFTSDTAQKTGATERSIQKSIRRASKISKPVRDLIRDVEEIADNSLELDALAGMDEAQQKAAVQAVLNGKVGSVREFAQQQMVNNKGEDVNELNSFTSDTAQDTIKKVGATGMSGSGKQTENELASFSVDTSEKTGTKGRIFPAFVTERSIPPSVPSPTSSTDLLDQIEKWKQRALQAENESINLQHRLDDIELNGAFGTISRGVIFQKLLDDLEFGLSLSPESFYPQTLHNFRERFLRLITAIEQVLSGINQPILSNGEQP